MIELRWVTGGPNRALEYRQRAVSIDSWGGIRQVKEWTPWTPVREIDVNEAAMEDMIDSGGLPAVGG